MTNVIFNVISDTLGPLLDKKEVRRIKINQKRGATLATGLACSRDVMVATKLGQIGLKWDKSGDFYRSGSVHFDSGTKFGQIGPRDFLR